MVVEVVQKLSDWNYEDRATLAKPIDNKLFFAGEATHTHFLGTVHGAYETGMRAARELIRVME